MTLPRGLLQVYTGNGKGKTTAAVGLAVRAHGAGLRVCFLQFVKGGPMSSELGVLEGLGVEVVRPARMSTGLLADGVTEEDRRAASVTWDLARRALASDDWDVVILDEVNVALAHGLVAVGDLLEALGSRAETTEVVCTGRGAPRELLAEADLVTEMVSHRHPFEAGTAARAGIEY